MNSIQHALAQGGEEKQKERDRSEVRSLLNHPKAENFPLLLVEGSSDIRIYKKLLEDTDFRFKYVGGCEIVIEFINYFYPNYHDKVAGIIDSDFRRLNTDLIPFEPDALAPNLFVTDLHDWENMTLTDSSLKLFWNQRRNRSTLDYPNNLLDRVKNGLESLSYMKWAHSRLCYYNSTLPSEERKEGWNFEKCTMENCFDKPIRVCLEVLKNTQQNIDNKFEFCEEVITSLKTLHPAPDSKQFYVGHDLCKGIAFVIKRDYFNPKPQISKNCVPNHLIENYSLDDFHQTDLYNRLRDFYCRIKNLA